MTPQQTLKRPIITERATDLGEKLGMVTFEVEKTATKHQIKDAVETAYGVKVVNVRTMTVPGKLRRRGTSVGKRPNWKKAMVTLKKGDVIDFFATE